MEPSTTPLIPVTVPTMTIERFSELSGLDEGVIQGHIRRGYLPTVKMGRYRMINVALLTARCLSTEETQ
ncbi:DNA-binding protein [Halomonas dongshanensis]|uniref:DNA-binding protein n=1 Tax=Halomonas dongshanensis TaxID=2890835 RepID=A0ABT2EDK3_9GAMM|nr:DNA-binding protein [Halomonas dongshanensis]MCS2609653.1 DNA-binding protein [Halomonas dongshanensis]